MGVEGRYPGTTCSGVLLLHQDVTQTLWVIGPPRRYAVPGSGEGCRSSSAVRAASHNNLGACLPPNGTEIIVKKRPPGRRSRSRIGRGSQETPDHTEFGSSGPGAYFT